MRTTSPSWAPKRSATACCSAGLKNCTMLDSSLPSTTRIQVMPLAPKPGTICFAYSFCSTFLLRLSEAPLTFSPLIEPPLARICLKIPYRVSRKMSVASTKRRPKRRSGRSVPVVSMASCQLIRGKGRGSSIPPTANMRTVSSSTSS